MLIKLDFLHIFSKKNLEYQIS